MPPNSKSPRLRRYLLAALIAAGAYLLREHFDPGASAPLDPSSLPEIVDTAYETLEGCRIIAGAGNDGDSFRVKHLGKEHTFRLYFVDCPETSNRYPDRIGHQARYFDDLTPEQTIAIGEEAKEFTLGLLKERPFAILTRWESVMKSYRVHAFVLVELESGETEHLSEILVRNGLARIYTLGTSLPDGTSRKEFEKHLKSLESQAKSEGIGAWGY